MNWAKAEFKGITLGDHRLEKRAIDILKQMGLAPGRSIPQVFQSWKEMKGCYNFFGNSSVSEKKLLEPHIEKTIKRIRDFPVVLLPSDTTEIDYTNKTAMEGKERLSNKKEGLWLHPTIAVTPQRLILGVVEANFWSRNPEAIQDNSAARQLRDKTPIEKKESYRWLKNYRRACEIAREVPGTQIINITDREGDIIEIYAESIEQKKQGAYANFIIRSQHDRMLDDLDPEGNRTHKKLRQKLKETPSLGEIEFTVPSTEKRKGRRVKQQLKSVTVTLITKRKKEHPVPISAVMAIEEAPPEGEEPLIWILITDLPVNTFDEANKVISYYMCRWEIELFFKVLKSGCKIEERQLQTTDRMKSLIALFLVLSWRVMFTMMLGRICPEMSCSDIFNQAEWKSVYKILNKKKQLPKEPPSLGEFVLMIAALGGYVNHKGGEPPGVKVMWKGMARMIDFALAWEAFGT
jgi:hypothetical protein